MLKLLHLCDSVFPLGGFGYSDGLETATAEGTVRDAATLGEWLDVALDETIGRLEGPIVWRAWTLIHEQDWTSVAALDEEALAMRPAASARQSSRAMGQRLLTTWRGLYPGDLVERMSQLMEQRALAPSLPVAFAGVCASAGIDCHQTVEAFAYTRLAATISAAMRLAPIGQRDAHGLLARALDRVPDVAAAIHARAAAPESFTPALDIAGMSQQYLHSRLFRS